MRQFSFDIHAIRVSDPVSIPVILFPYRNVEGGHFDGKGLREKIPFAFMRSAVHPNFCCRKIRMPPPTPLTPIYTFFTRALTTNWLGRNDQNSFYTGCYTRVSVQLIKMGLLWLSWYLCSHTGERGINIRAPFHKVNLDGTRKRKGFV
jgi:hypothetical protein